jgi:hypothetical protein
LTCEIRVGSGQCDFGEGQEIDVGSLIISKDKMSPALRAGYVAKKFRIASRDNISHVFHAKRNLLSDENMSSNEDFYVSLTEFGRKISVSATVCPCDAVAGGCIAPSPPPMPPTSNNLPQRSEAPSDVPSDYPSSSPHEEQSKVAEGFGIERSPEAESSALYVNVDNSNSGPKAVIIVASSVVLVVAAAIVVAICVARRRMKVVDDEDASSSSSDESCKSGQMCRHPVKSSS